MRLWSLHPKYLDSKGIVALWREALLAKNVLEGKTRGYINHPQLDRFKKVTQPVDAINEYLSAVYEEAERRGYRFDPSKISPVYSATTIPVQRGQLDYEFRHLLNKLQVRDPEKFRQIEKINTIDTHEMFRVVEGGIERWEIVP